MLICEGAGIEEWKPKAREVFRKEPEWWRAVLRGGELCNHLDGVKWLENPVQLILCDACGEPGCSSSNYAHVSALGDEVLWTIPQVDEMKVGDRDGEP